jgi:hypothetical protein
MAKRVVVVVVFMTGVAVGLVGGAALSIHAANEGGVGSDAQPVPDPSPDIAPQVAEPPRGIWDDLAQCEAGGDWHNARNPIYKGGLQFDAATWSRHGGLAFAWRADFATRAQQIIVGQRTLAAQGPRAWPICGPRVGLR